MTVKEVLVAAKDEISNPKNWTQKVYARDSEGNFVSYDSSEAVCWCSDGALNRVTPNYGIYSKAELVLKSVMDGNIINFNDTRTHEEVMQAFDKAISSL
jgi:hypothetical protein